MPTTIKTMQEASSGDLTELADATEVQIDTRDGNTVTIPAGTYLKVQCTMLPGVIQCTVEEGDYEGRTVFVDRLAYYRP